MRDFNHTVNVLVQAYLNDTLVHGYCTACAVGNIVAASMDIEIKKNFGCSPSWVGHSPCWDLVFSCSGDVIGRKDFQEINPNAYQDPEVKEQIDSTGYSWQDLSRIELAFESVPRIKDKEQRMFNGLMAVIDVLADIHGIDLTQKEEAKKLFQKV